MNPTQLPAIELPPSQMADALDCLLRADEPAFIWGPPGIAKSDMVRQLGERHGMPVYDFRAVIREPVDLAGLPHIEGPKGAKRTHHAPPIELPSEKNWIFFLDEVAQAPAMMQAACMELVLDRRVGGYELPEGCYPIAASNRIEDRAGAHRIITPLLNRFTHMNLTHSVEDWLEWSLQAEIPCRRCKRPHRIRHEVRAFIKSHPMCLMTFDPKTGANAFATPRSVASLSNILQHDPGDALHPIAAGRVGLDVAAQFVAHLQIYGKIPTPEEIIAKPTKVEIPDNEPAAMYAVCMSIAEHMRTRDREEQVIEPLMQFVPRLGLEYGVLTMSEIATIAPRVLASEHTRPWVREHSPQLMRVSKIKAEKAA